MFLALDLPGEARDALERWRDELLAGRSELRPVAPQALHVTLVFLGWQAEPDSGRIAELAFDAAAGRTGPLLTSAGVRAVPPRRPRLFALSLDDEDERAALLHAAVSEALEKARLYRPEKRPFWAHVTLARVKRGQRAEPLPETPPPAEPFHAAALTLYRSILRPQGALYEPLARRPLEG